ncbi:Glucose-6-phosphate exchanger SLC37A1 [Galemys pyrenaicus]|uniref:Glucose-6-phosphate exchanger SLC37A1 n=1 Tax=Galemys pyrenaicus TaxID=202257 RepID=A0A8J6ACM0_GALPY|nr:Glucose-6-phosphate exchanger SLC37A1 [Galemys pyrenaicus]
MAHLPPGIHFLAAFSRDQWYRAFTFALTFLLYASFHLSRKPISIVKGELHRDCAAPEDGAVQANSPSQRARDGSRFPLPDNQTGCGWAPFDQDNYQQLLGALDYAFLCAYAVGMYLRCVCPAGGRGPGEPGRHAGCSPPRSPVGRAAAVGRPRHAAAGRRRRAEGPAVGGSLAWVRTPRRVQPVAVGPALPLGLPTLLLTKERDTRPREARGRHPGRAAPGPRTSPHGTLRLPRAGCVTRLWPVPLSARPCGLSTAACGEHRAVVVGGRGPARPPGLRPGPTLTPDCREALAARRRGIIGERLPIRLYLTFGMLASGAFTALFGLGYFYDVHSLGFYVVAQPGPGCEIARQLAVIALADSALHSEHGRFGHKAHGPCTARGEQRIANGLVQTTGWPSVVTCLGNWFGKGRVGQQPQPCLASWCQEKCSIRAPPTSLPQSTAGAGPAPGPLASCTHQMPQQAGQSAARTARTGRGLIMGVWNSHTSVGNILGSLIAGYWVSTCWGLSFVVPGAIVAAMGVVCFLFLIERGSSCGPARGWQPPHPGSSRSEAAPSRRHVSGLRGGRHWLHLLPAGPWPACWRWEEEELGGARNPRERSPVWSGAAPAGASVRWRHCPAEGNQKGAFKVEIQQEKHPEAGRWERPTTAAGMALALPPPQSRAHRDRSGGNLGLLAAEGCARTGTCPPRGRRPQLARRAALPGRGRLSVLPRLWGGLRRVHRIT